MSLFEIFKALTDDEISTYRHVSFVSIFIAPFVLRYLVSRNALEALLRFALPLTSLLSIILSASRTGLLVFVLSYLGSRGVYQSRSRLMLGTLGLIVVAVALYPLLPQYDPANVTFVGKIQNSFNEILFESGEERISMYVNWRGYESYQAFHTWLHASPLRQIIGSGLGATIDIGFYLPFEDGNEIRFFPYVHNGYFTILVKYGVVGLLLFFIFLLTPLGIQSVRLDRDGIFINNVRKTSAIILIYTTIVIAGPLNKNSIDGILLISVWAVGANMYRVKILKIRNV